MYSTVPTSIPLRAGHLGHAEIANLRLALRRQQYVRRLQVAVYDALLMGVVHRPGQGFEPHGCLAGPLRPTADLGREASPLDELEREVGSRQARVHLVFAYLVELYDVGVLQPCHGFGFRTEACPLITACE
jgi:hypothetical protein